jgi:rhamnose utilization protein RhaD (predicted bifunctional aldolase and dehydrogenase)
MTSPRRPDDLDDLARLSARIGADPLLIQAAGGNTSVKDGAVMWIKASGTQLADALDRDIFVACDLTAMRASMAAGEARADRPAEFVLAAGALRPSIETSLHAVFRQRVVVHVHCVNTIALAIRPDAEAAIARRLVGFDHAIVPYTKPGANLARAVMAALRPETNVVVLRNHGLIVAAETVAQAEALLTRVVAALTSTPLTVSPDLGRLAARADDAYAPLPADHPLHAVACEPRLLGAALAGSLYPDHVIFCGVGAVALGDDETPAMACARQKAAGLPEPAFLLVPGIGALIRGSASEGARALARCLGDVLSRLEPGAGVQALSLAENAELLDWDAEKYRQRLNAG